MNGKSWLIILSLTIAMFAFSERAFAGCNGNACGDLVVQQQDGCVILVNRNPRQAIKIISDSRPSSIYDVYANSQSRPTVIGGGGCHRTWFANYSANYM
jgi:hypothetical protein